MEKMTCETVYNKLLRTMAELMTVLRITYPAHQKEFLDWRAEKNTQIRSFQHLLADRDTLAMLYWGLTGCLKTKRRDELRKSDKHLFLADFIEWEEQRAEDQKEQDEKREELAKRASSSWMGGWW